MWNTDATPNAAGRRKEAKYGRVVEWGEWKGTPYQITAMETPIAESWAKDAAEAVAEEQR